ncbi:MAG: hypothetical protein J5793_05490 [Clostridia bacterium]|nr:hypothetical protein [Clostridia bacterium]
MKKLLVITLALAMILSACGGNEDISVAESKTAATESKTPEESASETSETDTSTGEKKPVYDVEKLLADFPYPEFYIHPKFPDNVCIRMNYYKYPEPSGDDTSSVAKFYVVNEIVDRFSVDDYPVLVFKGYYVNYNEITDSAGHFVSLDYVKEHTKEKLYLYCSKELTKEPYEESGVPFDIDLLTGIDNANEYHRIGSNVFYTCSEPVKVEGVYVAASESIYFKATGFKAAQVSNLSHREDSGFVIAMMDTYALLDTCPCCIVDLDGNGRKLPYVDIEVPYEIKSIRYDESSDDPDDVVIEYVPLVYNQSKDRWYLPEVSVGEDEAWSYDCVEYRFNLRDTEVMSSAEDIEEYNASYGQNLCEHLGLTYHDPYEDEG